MGPAREQTPVVIERLVNNHKQFQSFLMRRVSNKSDAEEILQAAFVKSVEKVDSIRDGETVVAWFYRLLRNDVIDYYRHRDDEHRALERLDTMSDKGGIAGADVERAVCQGRLPHSLIIRVKFNSDCGRIIDVMATMGAML